MVRGAFMLVVAALVATDCGTGLGTDQLSLRSFTALRLSGAGGTSVQGVSASSAGSSGSGARGGSSSASSPATIAKSAKRGVAYDLADPADLQALSPGVSWWYGWGRKPQRGVPADYRTRYQMDFYPMIWGINYDVAAIEDYLLANPQIRYLLVLNEPNLTSQADLTPQQAASLWPDFEAIAAKAGVKLVGPALSWGTMPGYTDPVVWLDAFYAAYEAANAGRPPQVDYLAFHWYDYGLARQLDRLRKYRKPFWVTELANWHSRPDGGQIDTLAKQQAQMTEMVRTCEARADVFRYAWFTGRTGEDAHHSNLLAGPGELSELGRLYLTLPYASP